MLRPLDDRILVKRVEKNNKSEGGILLPDTVQEKPMEGTVLAVGPGKWEDGQRKPLHVKKGDRVVFGPWAGDEISVNKEDLLVIREEDIIGVLK